MATVNLAPYDAQMAELDRRQRIAQALAAAGAEQQDVPAYKGISAMPSRAGMLANVLKSFVGARQERNSGRERTILGKQDTAAGQEFAQQMLGAMNPQQAPQMPPQAAQAPQGPFQGAPAPKWSPGQDASSLPWDATSQGTAAPTETGPAAPQQLAAAMGGAPAAPQTAKMPGGNSPPQAMSPEQLQATIAYGRFT
jgi:hypothetical protein